MEAQAGRTLSLAGEDVPVRTNFPPTPRVTSIDWRPPDQTDPVDTKPRDSLRLLLQANSVNHTWFAWVPDQPDGSSAAPNLIGFNTDVNNGLPWDYTLTLRSWLVLIPDSYASVTAPNQASRTTTKTYGISSTDSKTITSELGLDVKGFSAKVQAEFSQSVTISEGAETSHTWDVSAPPGKTRISAMWQVVDQLVALDPQGNVIPNVTRRGWANFTDVGPDDAFLSYASVGQVFPSPFLRESVGDFDIP